MALIYRAVWDDLDVVPTVVLADEFAAWCVSKGVSEPLPYRGIEEQRGRTVEVRRADTELGRILRMSLAEVGADGRRWTTTATALSDSIDSTFWVDLECVDDRDRPPDVVAPRLVRQLLSSDGSPTTAGVPLHLDAVKVESVDDVEELRRLIVDPSRDLPVAVFAYDHEADASTNLLRARHAAEILAGVANVYSLEASSTISFNRLLPSTLQVHRGAVRFYLGQLVPDDEDDQRRHRFILPKYFDRSARRAGLLLAQRLSTVQRWSAPPPVWGRLQQLIAGPSESELSDRVAALRETFPTVTPNSNIVGVIEENDQLKELLAVAEAERDYVAEQLQHELDLVKASHDTIQGLYIDALDELESVVTERDGLRRSIRFIAASDSSNQGSPEASVVNLAEIEDPLTASAAIDLARSHLHRVVIAEGAPRELDAMDGSEKGRIWAASIWRALQVLEQYAQSVASAESQAGFFIWCKDSGEWPVDKLAMHESESVMRNEVLSRMRSLPVDRAINPSGRITMEAHLKIQMGGGPTIPRIYFYDSTRGPTGCVHVGFIGPHSLMPNLQGR
jgi:hypothetical protein